MEKYELHREYHCYLGWREKPLGTGEGAVLVIPLEDEELTEKQLKVLMDPLKVTTFSEETVDFTILELDLIDEQRKQTSAVAKAMADPEKRRTK